MGKRFTPVPPGARRSEWVTRPCGGCGATVERRASEMRELVYCTRACYQKHGASVVGRQGGRPRTKETLIVETSAGPKAAVITDGYVNIYWASHPSANRAGRVAQHRLVMEEHLGRRLLPGENVHHRDGNRRNNALENLELWARWQPAGQRVEDVVEHAEAMLRRYAPGLLAQARR